jgi:WD40 repeat protein
MLIIDARDLSIKSNTKLKFEATAMDICGNQIWIGDKKGNLHVFDASVSEIKAIEGKHSKAVTVVASNGKVVASGDAYRYMYVWDGESHEELFSSGDHKDKILDIFFTETHMLSVTHDNAFGVSSLEDRKFLRQQKMPHGEK